MSRREPLRSHGFLRSWSISHVSMCTRNWHEIHYIDCILRRLASRFWMVVLHAPATLQRAVMEWKNWVTHMTKEGVIRNLPVVL